MDVAKAIRELANTDFLRGYEVAEKLGLAWNEGSQLFEWPDKAMGAAWGLVVVAIMTERKACADECRKVKERLEQHASDRVHGAFGAALCIESIEKGRDQAGE